MAMAVAFLCAAAACTSQGRYAAHGWLTPGPTGDPELIGLFDAKSACEEAAKDWASRQVVGNPVFVECTPTDRNERR
jgi:hypothetical protein